MKRKMRLFTAISLSIMILLSCSKQPDTEISELEKQFSSLVPLTDMNKSLQLAVNSQEKFFNSGSEIELTIYNKSLYSLYFDNDAHMRLLVSLDKLHWTEVKNAITHSATMVLSPKGTILLDTQYTSVKPILDQTSFNAKGADFLLRVVIVGEIMDGETRTGEKVGAYVDVAMKPSENVVQPREAIIYSTESGSKGNGGRIEGTITSEKESGEPLPNVTVSLLYHPMFNNGGQSQAIATTNTDAQGKYSFVNVKPGIYALQITLALKPGGSCVNFDLARIIKIDIGTVARVDFRPACNHF